MSLEKNINNLKRITQELAGEIHDKEYGDMFRFMRLLFDRVESYVSIVDKNCNLIYINPSAIRNYKERTGGDIEIGDKCIKLLQNNPEFCKECLAKDCINQKIILNKVFISPNTGLKYWRTCIPLIYDGVSGVIEILEKYNGG